VRGRTLGRLTTRPHGGGGAGPGRRGPRAPASPARGSPRSTPPARSPGSSPSRRASGRRPKWPWRPATSSRPPRRRTPGSSGKAILNSTTLHNVLLPGAGTGGKTCPCRAMMAASDTVRRFRLPVPCSRLGLYDCRPGRSPGFLVAARMLPGRCPGLHAKRVRRGGRLNVDRRCLWPRLTTRVRRGGRLNVAGRRLSTSCSPVPGPCSRLHDLYRCALGAREMFHGVNVSRVSEMRLTSTGTCQNRACFDQKQKKGGGLRAQKRKKR